MWASFFFNGETMYYRISGAPFTIKTPEEKKEFLDIINSDSIFSEHLLCRGVDIEQFTGKVNSVVVGERDNPNRVYIFKCEGNFPTLKLYQKTSSVVYAIEFPVLEKPVIFDPTAVEDGKPVNVQEEPNSAAGENKVEEVAKEVTEVISNLASEYAVEEKPVEDAFSVDPFEREEPVVTVVDSLSVEDTISEPVNNNDQPKRRGRKKKNQ